jgi:serine/threonine protein kinase
VNAPSAVEDIFLAALDKRTPEERAAYLDAACKDDPDLRRRVERLLEAHPKAEQFLEIRTIPPRGGTAAYVPAKEDVGAVIAGRYKLVEEIGQGGMGTVWVAQQTEPVKRVVAVKLIKAGMDSAAVLARFEAERQALALMDHPNIARVLDGGATPDGRPFFVMELVKGVPITEFCDARRLTPRQRLELFVPVCQAIQHAHQKGVIHRDIKPSNVIVALYDDRPVPKVIDFGVAKATGQTLTDKSLMTGFGAVVGTPEYMSPEQASLNNLDIDTRSDVYSLGVLLYELLAGSPPFRSEELKKAGLIEMLRMVCEDEPPRPSIKLSTANKRASISADRGTEPGKLTGLLRNELDWIVMKALEKDRARRYETVNGFAADVQRYLAGEAVQAHPPSAIYRLRKFVRKHRVGLATAASFLGLLVVAAGVSIRLAVDARKAAELARQKSIEAEANAKEAKENEELYANASGQNMVALIASQMNATSLQIDLDLSELRTDSRVGLLRLAHPRRQDILNPNTPGQKLVGTAIDDKGQPIPWSGAGILEVDNASHDYKALREFTTLAVLAAGQQFAPLLPPITHDGQPVTFASLSPDNLTMLTLGKDNTARLWEARTFRPIAVLRQGNERVITCGFSPDGKTVFTDDQTSIARFWDVPTGRFRAATEARKNRYNAPENWPSSNFPRDVSQIGAGRLLTRTVIVKSETSDNAIGGPTLARSCEGPVELWDTATGRLVARLDEPGRIIERFQFINQGRWLSTIDQSGATLLIFSADEGRLLARLSHPAGEVVDVVGVSPTGRQVATVCGSKRGGVPPEAPIGVSPYSLRLWNTDTWRAEPMTTPLDIGTPWKLRFWIDSASEGLGTLVAVGDALHNGRDSRWAIYRYGQNEPVAKFPVGDLDLPFLFAREGFLAHGGDGEIYDMRTWQRLLPPPGRRFHPDLARFAPDGRFVGGLVNNELAVIDTRTDKQFPAGGVWHHMPGFGLVENLPQVKWGPVDNGSFQFFPPPDRLNLVPPDMLELWAQVVVCGHLDDRGAFVKWDLDTWEKKRQELAAKPVPNPDFPFPGYVATDRLHWLKQEYGNANEAARPDVAAKLVARAEAIGDKSQAVYWHWVSSLLPHPSK